jgi:hypothetical protein
MKATPAPVPHHVLVQAFAGEQQYGVALKQPLTAAQAGAPHSRFTHALGHLWSGDSVYHTPALGLTHHLPKGG